MLDRGVNVNARYANELTALMWAAGYGKMDTVRLLVTRGADVSARDNRGKTAYVIAQEQGYKTVAALLKSGHAQR